VTALILAEACPATLSIAMRWPVPADHVAENAPADHVAENLPLGGRFGDAFSFNLFQIIFFSVRVMP